ncbi:MAG: transaldolase [Campylobacterales bacterium]|nr:transaldolase [Campylobacterales bacterium]
MINRNKSFSLWLDFIERDFLKNEFPKLIQDDIINGATSNPSIFADAIQKSPAYKNQLNELKGLSPKEKYEALAIEDIKLAAHALRESYSEGNDGYISLEVDPFLSNDTKATVREAKRLFKAIGEPNVMIKIPATEAGYSAMRQLLATGISVNATLIFSPEQAMRCVRAMKKGMSIFENSGGRRVQAVISVFVSRFDRLLDPKLKELGLDISKTGIYNAARIYNIIEESNAPMIRTLFASTGVKEGVALPSDYYICELFAPHSVNTAPLETIKAYTQRSQDDFRLPISDEEIEDYFETMNDNGIDMNEVYGKLLEDGLKAFENSFEEILNALKD